jgi:hypothetical protein
MIDSYSWNIGNWILRRLPNKRRTVINTSWLKALLFPLQEVSNDFSARCQDWDFRIKYNSQQKVLSYLLNQLFDPTLARIRVVTTSDITPPTIIYDDQENPDAPILYDDAESLIHIVLYDEDEVDSNYDFKVIVPAALSSNEARIKAWVERYRLGSKRFTIIYE